MASPETTAGHDSSARDRFIAKSKFEIERAKQLGLERLPSVNGPYLVDRSTDRVVAGPKSAAYRVALYGVATASPPEEMRRKG